MEVGGVAWSYGGVVVCWCVRLGGDNVGSPLVV